MDPQVTESRWIGGKTALVQSEDDLIHVQCKGNPVQLWLQWLDPRVTSGGPSMALYIRITGPFQSVFEMLC